MRGHERAKFIIYHYHYKVEQYIIHRDIYCIWGTLLITFFNHRMPPPLPGCVPSCSSPHLILLLFQMCSANFGDNILMFLDIFHHFWGLVLCNLKLSWFQIGKKTECKGTVMKFYMLINIPFKKLMELLPHFALRKIVSHCDGLHCHFCCFLTKNVFTQISSCLTVYGLQYIICY